MTLTDALLYLETTARVSCPQITCEQAREIAELLHERDEARAKLREVEGERNAWFSVYEEAADRERYAQAACGFAWDAGREMARLENPHDEADRNVQRAAQTWSKGRGVTVFVDPPEVGEDFDADDYAKPGKR